MKKISSKIIITIIFSLFIFGLFAAISFGGPGGVPPPNAPTPPLCPNDILNCFPTGSHNLLSLNAATLRFTGLGADIGPVDISNPPEAKQKTLKITGNESGAFMEVRDGNLQATVQINGQHGSINMSGDLNADGQVTTHTITTDTITITGGNDIVEPFEVTNRGVIKPGMVVSIHTERLGQLRIADSAYDRTVAGIVSGANGINPGLTMTQTGTVADGALPVALTGRVYAWADASYGPIKPGDLLTTSDTPGHVMKVTDYEKAQGAVLGKAMTGLKQGKGLVLILVSLQ